MPTTCRCVTNVRIQDACQARFRDAAGVQEHQCSRRVGHAPGHLADECGATDQLKVLRRAQYAREIDIECPHCWARVPLAPAHVTKLSDGVIVVGRCPSCQKTIDVSFPAIGGYLWSSS